MSHEKKKMLVNQWIGLLELEGYKTARMLLLSVIGDGYLTRQEQECEGEGWRKRENEISAGTA